MTPFHPPEYILPAPSSTQRLVSADGTALYTESHGPAESPTVVLVHGWTCSTHFWAPVTHRLLGQGLRVVLYDLRGHGRSARPHRKGYSTTALADDLEAVLRAQVPEGGKAVIAGHSMGAMSVLACADRAALGERTAAVLLASTAARDLLAHTRVIPVRHPGLRRAVHQLMATSWMPLGPVNPVTQALLKLGTMGAASSREQAAFCAKVITSCGRRTRSAWGRVLTALDVAGGIAHLAVPTSVVVGTADKLTPVPHSELIASRLPRLAEFVRLPGAGHMIPVERPAEVADAIVRLTETHLLASRTGVA